jgi:hypothetical protein
MAYSTPHDVRDYLIAASLCINHDFVIRCQRRSVAQKKQLLESVREIDLYARLAEFIGPVAHLAAQSAAPGAIDLEVDGPTIRAEVKYFRPPARNFSDNIKRDWDWLLNTSNNGNEFNKRTWVVFWPSASADMFSFTNCLSVPRSHGAQYSLADFAPFVSYAEPEMPPHGVNQRLRFKSDVPASHLIFVPDGKRVRCDVVGSPHHALWCAVYTLAPADVQALGALPRTHIDDAPIQI